MEKRVPCRTSPLAGGWGRVFAGDGSGIPRIEQSYARR